MNKYIQRLLLFEKYVIQTKKSKREILKKIESFADPKYNDYYTSIFDDGFYIAEKNIKSNGAGFSKNSFAPTAKAKIEEKDGISSVTVVLRMNILVLVLFAPIYFLSLMLVFPFPIMLIILYFAFVKPSERLKEILEDLVLEE